MLEDLSEALFDIVSGLIFSTLSIVSFGQLFFKVLQNWRELLRSTPISLNKLIVIHISTGIPIFLFARTNPLSVKSNSAKYFSARLMRSSKSKISPLFFRRADWISQLIPVARAHRVGGQLQWHRFTKIWKT